MISCGYMGTLPVHGQLVGLTVYLLHTVVCKHVLYMHCSCTVQKNTLQVIENSMVE